MRGPRKDEKKSDMPSDETKPSRFPEYRSDRLLETIAICFKELKEYLPTSTTALLETPKDSKSPLTMLVGDLSRLATRTVAFAPELRQCLSPGRAVTVKTPKATVAVLPITVFGSINHFLAFEPLGLHDLVAVSTRAGIFSSRISALLEFHFVTHDLAKIARRDAAEMIDAYVMHEMKHLVQQVAFSISFAIADARKSDGRNLEKHLLSAQEHCSVASELLSTQRNQTEFSYRLRPVRDIIKETEDSWRLVTRKHRLLVRPPVKAEILDLLVSAVAFHILNALLINSAEAIRESNQGDEGTVEVHISAEPGSNFVTFLVADNGYGILPEIRDQIFDFGFTTKGRQQGFGLYVGRRLAQDAGGTLTLAESEAARGAALALRLPSKSPCDEN